MKYFRILKLLLVKLKMSYKVNISDSAKTDIKEATLWYNKQQKGLGKDFTQNIKECVKIIQLQPKSFQVRYKNCRAGIPDKFPYLIVYNINKDNKTISIIAVFHSSQNPEKWKNEV